MKVNNYKFGFNISALVIFAIIMLPNIIWFIVPFENDILKGQSSTEILDTIGIVLQILMIMLLCVIRNDEVKEFRFSLFIILSVVFCLLYYICWVLYFCSIVNGVVLIGLCILPCLSFTFYAVDRKNYIAILFIALYFIFHLISTIINYL